MSPGLKSQLTGEDIDRALTALDEEFGKSELLMSLAPIRFMVSGGMLAVQYFRLRTITEDVDCLTDPNVDTADIYRDEIALAVVRVAEQLGLERSWFNDELKIFIQMDKRLDLFLQSIDQDIVIFQGSNLVVYAAAMEWQLERKLRRIATGTNKREQAKDISDAVALVRHLKGNGPPLSRKYVEGLNYNGWELSMSRGIDRVRDEYASVYGEPGIDK
ncbi:hypothetical protein GGR50DRAFT_425119 [Xylaria sp. CBS 124048]|nr:hypothetical protein GGR50DRAFT_425119 [Xylaria sp. CBS 124048]